MSSAAKKSTEVATREEGGAVVTQEALRSPKLIERISARFGVDPDKMLDSLKSTAFKQRPARGDRPAVVVTNEHMMMLLVIAEQYHLNPFTKEIYAFPQEGGIVPIIGYDGWLRLMNEHPQHDYCEDHYAPPDTPQDEWYHEVEIKRKDRSRPTITRKYLKEYYRDTDPWNSMPRHMIELKTTIQCIRKAYGFAGVYDPDEGERIFASAIDITPRDAKGKPKTEKPQARVKQDAPASKGTDDLITPGDVVRIEDKANAEGIPLNAICAKFEVGALRELKATQVDAAIAFIDDVNAPE